MKPMTDEELLNFVEQKLFYEMLLGCETGDDLGYKRYGLIDDWYVSFRADTISRLLDMAKGNK